MKPNEPRTDAVHVLICGQPVWLDLHNLKDESLCVRDKDGSYETETGEQHFTWENAVKAAEKQGKRLLTCEEQIFLTNMPRRWDDEKQGMWFTLDRVEGGEVEVFFPAADYRHSNGEIFNKCGNICSSRCGNYWADESKGDYDFYLGFTCHSIVFRNCTTIRDFGISVRCINV
jgi:hypothetical protein